MSSTFTAEEIDIHRDMQEVQYAVGPECSCEWYDMGEGEEKSRALGDPDSKG